LASIATLASISVSSSLCDFFQMTSGGQNMSQAVNFVGFLSYANSNSLLKR